jgi:hypothetical protein
MRAAAALLSAVLLIASPVCAAAPPARPSGIFSNLSYNSESGDLGGIELLVLPAPGRDPEWRVLVQIAEGGAPYVALVPLVKVGDHFEFTLPPDSGFAEPRFSIRITAAEAIVTQLPHGVAERLRRGKSYWE